jgi:hypothetical protein
LAKDWECLNRKALAFLRLTCCESSVRKHHDPGQTLKQPHGLGSRLDLNQIRS